MYIQVQLLYLLHHHKIALIKRQNAVMSKFLLYLSSGS